MEEFAKQKKLLLLVRQDGAQSAELLAAALQRQFVDPLLKGGEAADIQRIVLNQVKMHGFRPKTNKAGHNWSAILEIYAANDSALTRLLRSPVLTGSGKGAFDEVVCFPVAEKIVFGSDDISLPIKVFNFYKATDRALSHRQWAAHANFGKSNKVDAVMPKYAQNATLPDHHAAGGRYDYDGVAISWFGKLADADSIFRNAEFMKKSDADGLAMGIHAGDVVDILTDERIIYRRDT
jgi:hypothetical protein